MKIDKVKIDKGMPIIGHGSKFEKWPWNEMEVGDSFLIAPAKSKSHAYNLAKAACYRLHPKIFKARTVDDGFRIWRTE